MSYDSEINYYLKPKVKHFLGCFASNQLPTNPPHGSSLIVNYSKSDQRGTHWVAMRNLNTSNVQFFDSYGFDADAEDIILSVHTNFVRYLKKNSKNNRYVHNELNLQHIESDTCGEYSAKFIKDGLPMNKNGVINKKWEKYVKSNNLNKNNKMILNEIRLRGSR
mgnify:CR=1 FL=1